MRREVSSTVTGKNRIWFRVGCVSLTFACWCFCHCSHCKRAVSSHEHPWQPASGTRPLCLCSAHKETPWPCPSGTGHRKGEISTSPSWGWPNQEIFCKTSGLWGLPWWFSGSRIQLQCRKLPTMRTPGFALWVRKIPWRRKWQPTPVFFPGDSHGQRSLAGYSPW